MVTKAPSFFPRRINMYVPACQYSAEVELNGPTRISFGSPEATSASSLINAVSAAGGITVLAAAMGQATSGARYGRTLTYVLGGAGAVLATTTGQDFWGQTITETITTNGATPVVGLKAFMSVISFVIAAVAQTVSVGWGASFGVPYKVMKCLAEDVNTSSAGFTPGTVGTVIAPVLTDPQTALLGDPRGAYTPNVAIGVTKEIVGTFIFDNSVNAAGNGGLMGIKGA